MRAYLIYRILCFIVLLYVIRRIVSISRDSTINVNGGLNQNENYRLEIAFYIAHLAEEAQLKRNYINRRMKLGGSGKPATVRKATTRQECFRRDVVCDSFSGE